MPKPTYPPTRSDNVVEVLHGEQVADPYRWLENGDSPDTQAWTAAQNAATRDYLDAVPARRAIRNRLEQLLTIGAISAPTPARGRYFYQRRDGSQNQPVLYVRDGVGGADRVLLDLNAMDAAGTTALDWYFPNEDGSLLAYGLSTNGSEESVLQILQVNTGMHLPDRISQTRACDVAWLPDGTGFYYTRYPHDGEVPVEELQYHRAVFFHRLGTDPAADPLILKPVQKEHWPGVTVSPDGRWLLVTVARTFDQTDLYLQDRLSGGPLTAIIQGLPHQFEGHLGHDALYIRSNIEGSNYGLYLADPTRPAPENWRAIVPPREDAVLDGVMLTRRRLGLSYLERASSRLLVVDLDGGNPREVPLPTIGSLFGWGGEPDGDELFYAFSSYTVPPSVYRVELTGMTVSLWRRVEADLDPDRFELRQVTYPSRDGTLVTMFVVHRRGLRLDGSNPTYLTGYGGFNISMSPGFSRSLLLWMEQGGVVAVPNIRGGGEYGEAWHQGGMLATKQNSFDDFIAAAEYLIREKYTSPGKLAIAGGSNGGLLMGAVLTQRPDLFRAVVVQVPLLDMLRYHRFRIARLWIPEYGSSEDPRQFAWLRAYSPLHQVRDGVSYPAVFLATAESDTRVDPLHARKMAARLQAATASDRPILLRLEERAGHGAGKPVSKVLEELVDTWSFVFRELGMNT